MKVKTEGERALKRSRRLRKKLALGEFEQKLIYVTAEFCIDTIGDTDEEIEAICDMADEIIDTVAAKGGHVGCLSTSKSTLTLMFELAKSKCHKQIVKAFSELDAIVSYVEHEPVNAYYDDIWDEDDPFEHFVPVGN